MSSLYEQDSAETLELIRQAQNGNQDAFAALYHRYEPLIASQCRRFAQTLSHTDLEDLISEAGLAFLNAVRNFRTGEDSRVTFGRYAQICIQKRLISYLRHQRKQGGIVQLDADEMAELPAGEDSDPASRILEQEQYAILHQLMEQVLSNREKEVWFRFIAGRTAGEIAKELKQDKRSVENAIFRARRKLRRALPPQE